MVLYLLSAVTIAFASCATAEEQEVEPAGGGGQGGVVFAVDSGSGGTEPDAACAFYSEQATGKPVNLYIMYDKSVSMAGSKWTSAQLGMSAFLNDEASEGLRVAIRFFPRDADTTPVCDQYAYKDPTVDFGELPGHASNIETAISSETPDGFNTPMYPALGGALLEGIEVAQDNPDEASAVLLVTDGQPQGPAALCGGVDPEDPAVIAGLAATGANYNPPVATFVVGLPGVDQSTANQIAQAGGTESAILVSANDVQEEFKQALLKVRGKAVPCEYALPQPVIDGEVGISLVNIELTTGEAGAEPEMLPYNPSCNGDGWSYDDPDAPTEIVLCPQTCTALKEDFGAAIKVVLGCNTIVK